MKRSIRLISLFTVILCITASFSPSFAQQEETDFSVPYISDTSDFSSDEEIALEAELVDLPQELAEADIPAAIMTVDEAKEEGHIARIKDAEESLNSVVFSNEDGTRSVYLYNYPVKYVDADGKIQDKSLEIASPKTQMLL